MSRRISNLSESPCSLCSKTGECEKKLSKSPQLYPIMYGIMGNADYDFHDCGIYISLTCSDMIDES